MTPAELEQRISALPRAALASLPTPLQPAPRLARKLDVPSLWIKRDDLTGLALGGNKSRGLELIMGDALDQDATVLVAGGGVEQSNHAVQCAAAANRAGLRSVLVLRRRPDALAGGNDLIRDLLGAETVWVDADPGLSDRAALDETIADVTADLRQRGERPYALASSLHPLTVIGYVRAVLELVAQVPDPERPTSIYLASEGAALGGLVLGTRLLGLPWRVSGIAWRPLTDPVPRLLATVEAAAQMLGVDCPVAANDLEVLDGGPEAYGEPSESGREAMRMAAELESVILDPVYSAKGFAGMVRELATGGVDRAVFVHTGGVGATFAYGEYAYVGEGGAS